MILQQHFPADAWLANYDVAGTHHNNIIVDYTIMLTGSITVAVCVTAPRAT
jgi:hypothetical protein